MERRRAAGALLALAACILCTAAAPTASNHTALDLYDGEPEGCYYNFQHYGEGDRIMTNEPCLNCTCHNRMLMCYLRVCPFTKPIGQDCTVEKRADQCCPIVTCPDVPVDLLTLTSTTSPAEYGATGIGKLDKYGCSIDGKYFPEGSKVPPTPNKPCEHCYCIRNMTTCVMQECTLHVDGCTPIYHKDVCCPVRYSCDHLEDEILLLDDKTTTVRPTPGFLLTTTNSPVAQFTQDCVHDDQIFSDGALIKTEKACEHCYCMKGDIVCVVQECGTPMENEGKNCTSLPPREGQCCPDTYICEGDELNTEFPADLTTEFVIEDITTLSPPRRVGVEGSGYRKEPDNIAFVEPHPTEPTHEGSGDSHQSEQASDLNDVFTTEDSTKYIHSTVPSTENIVTEDSEKATSMQPSAVISSSTDILVSEDDVKATTIPDTEQKIAQEDTAELHKTEITTSIPSYDHKLETSQPEVQYVTESEIIVHDDKITRTTKAPDLEKTTTVKPHEENIVTDTVIIQHDKYLTTTVAPILEDEGITTEVDREQQMISTGSIKEHSYEPGLHTASTTSAPFLEEVEGIPTGTYGQNVVSDGITESDMYDFTKDKSEAVTTPAVGDNDNLIDKDEHTGLEVTKIPEIESHGLPISTTNIPILEEVEKTSTAFPVDLVTSKSSEETYEGDKFISTSTHQPISLENEVTITENLNESPATTQIPESSDSQKLDDETEKYQTEKYDQVTDQKTYGDYADISTTPSGSVIDQKGEEVIKTSEEPVTALNYGVESEIKDSDKQVTTPPNAPIDNDNLSTVDDKDINKPHVLDTAGSTKPTYNDDSERVTTQETSLDISTEKQIDQEKSQTASPSSAPITEEFEMATTEFIKDQDFVTTALMDQESIKPGEYVPSTSSTPFLEEIEKQTTEVSQGHVLTDVIADKEDIKPPKHVIYATETSLPVETEYITTAEPDKGLNTIPSGTDEETGISETPVYEKTTQFSLKEKDVSQPHEETIHDDDIATTIAFSLHDDSTLKEDKNVATTEPSSIKEDEHSVEPESIKIPELVTDISVESTPATESFEHQESTTKRLYEESHDNLGTVSSQELTTETSKVEEHTSVKEIKPDVELVTLSTQITPTLPEVTTINLGENEIDEDNILPPGRIPGEGDCLLNGITYSNESVVPRTNKCHSDCRCVSSIIKCSPIICSSPPEYMDNCQPTYDSPDSCCPTYVCDQFRETLPPMPHVQITTTELPQQPSTIDCRGDQCNIEEVKIQSTVPSELCANKDCGSEIDKKTDINSCGPHGCIESHSTPELCSGDSCTHTSEECANGDCKHQPATISEVQCEGKDCESSALNIPHAPECENGICKDKVPETIPVIVPCTEEDGCKGTEVSIAQDCADETCRRKETLDIQAKPSTCVEGNCEQISTQVAIETSTLGETLEIKTESPELHLVDVMTTETTIYKTTVLEKQEYATGFNDYDTTISFETTKQTDKISEFGLHKESSISATEEEPKMTESSSSGNEFITETHTKSPLLDSENDDIPTKIPEEYITESHQIDIEPPQIPTEKQPIFETSDSDDSKYTKPTQNVPDTEAHTVSVLPSDKEIPTKQPNTTEPEEVLATTSEPKVLESEKYNTEQPEHSITEVTEAQIIESNKHTSVQDISIGEHEQYTEGPVYTIPKSEDNTMQPAVEISQEITTEYQSQTVSEYQSGPKSTTLSPTDITLKQSDEQVTESAMQTGDIEMYTQPHKSSSSSQGVSLESSTQENTEAYLPEVTITSEEPALSIEPSRTTDKVTYVTEESLISSETDKIQKPEKEQVTGNELLELSITGTADSTTETSIRDHEINTENVLHVSLSEDQIATEVQKKTDIESTTPSIVDVDDTIVGILPEKKVTDSSFLAPHKIEEEIHGTTVGQDVHTETSEFLTTVDFDRITKKPHNIEQESTPMETTSEKSEILFHDAEQYTDVPIDPVTMPERTTKLPEILSHTKDHSTESPIVTEGQTDKLIEAYDNTDTTKQEGPSTEETLNIVTSESDTQTEKPETITEESQPPTIKDEATDSDIGKDKIEKPALIPQDISTEHVYTSDLEKSTEHVESFTTQPELHKTEAFITDTAKSTTVLTLIEKETASDLPDIIPVTDEYYSSIHEHKVEASTEKELFEYTSPHSYVPENQEPEISYTEKTQTVISDSTTETIEAFTTEQSQILMGTSTSPEVGQVITEKVPDIKEEEAPEIQEPIGITVVDITKADEMFTEPPKKYDTEEYLSTKIQEDVTQQQEFVTDIPEIHAITSIDQYSKAPESIPETFVTESQDTNEISDKVQVTELQTAVTELEHVLTTKQPDIEEPVKATESQPSTDVPKSPTEILTIQDEHAVTSGLLATTEETLSTDHKDITLSSATSQESLVTEINTDATESSHKATTLPESLSSTKSEEASTYLPQHDFAEHGETETVASEPSTEEPTEVSSQIPDSEKVYQEDPATKSPEPVDNVDIITQFDESHTIPQESATEIMGTELSTEPAPQIASESHYKDELTKPTSVPDYELPETTPYLIELQEHTHKTIEITTSSLSEDEVTTEQIASDIKHEQTVPDVVTDASIDKETEDQKPTKHYQETSTLLDISEKTTQPTISKDEQTLQTTHTGEIDIKETTIYNDQDFTTQKPTKLTEIEKESTPELPITHDVEKIITTSEKTIQSDFSVKITTPEETNILSTEKITTAIAEESPTQPPVAADKITKPEERPIETSTPLPDLSKPVPSEIQPTDEGPSPDEEAHFPPSGSSGYGNEPDYVEEDQPFSPGTCRYGGKVYVSAQQIPRDDPCDFCFCFRSDIICLQQSCPPPIHGCHEEPIQGFCCPRYECPVSMATTLNVTTTTTTTTTTLPPHFPTHSYKGAAQRRGCQIKGHTYKVGEVVRGSSGPCLHCTCGGDGQMKCDPKACTPEPMLRQMIAAAVSAKRRR